MNQQSKSKSIAICFVSPTAYSILSDDRTIKIVGGAELQQVIIAKELARRGHRVSMICLDHGQPEGVEFDGVTVHKCFRLDAGLPGIRAIIPRLSSLWRALRRADADIYFQRTATRYTGIVAAFARIHQKRSIYSAANDPDFAEGLPKLNFQIDKWIFQYGIRSVDKIIVQNQHQRELCRSQFSRDAQVIPNCLPSPGIRSAHIKGYVLWAATFKPEKRPELLLELANRLPDVKFRMVGGPSRGNEQVYDHIREQAETLENLEFVGFVPFADINPIFDGARVFVNTSDYEGFPNTFLQAWSRQIPTVSFINLDAEHDSEPVGIKVSSISEMSAAVSNLMSDDNRWRRAGERSQEYFDTHHSVAEVVDRLEVIFRKLSD